MSDLISRSELLESFRKSYCGHLGMENSDGMISFRSICRIINEQQTAYSVDNIVDELEKLADESYKAYCIAFNSDDRAEYDAYTDAIEIVKHGGVSETERKLKEM